MRSLILFLLAFSCSVAMAQFQPPPQEGSQNTPPPTQPTPSAPAPPPPAPGQPPTPEKTNANAPAPESSTQQPPPPPKDGNWVKGMDLGKLVGMATAPVNLIIAAAIAISFLIGKEGALADKFRIASDEYGKEPEESPRAKKLFDQMGILVWRLRLINWASRALAFTIVIFIGTVVLTSFGVTFPEIAWIKVVTGASLLAGLITMLAGFVLEVYDNCLEAKSVVIEMKGVRAARKNPQ